MTHRPTQIISGGQTGADQGALRAALDLGISTGGVAPKGYKTETGPHQVLPYVYGLPEGRAENGSTMLDGHSWQPPLSGGPCFCYRRGMTERWSGFGSGWTESSRGC